MRGENPGERQKRWRFVHPDAEGRRFEPEQERISQVGVAVRARPGLFLFLTAQWNDVTLPEGHFTTRLYRIVGETHVSPFIAITNNIQYDSQSSVLGWQSRFRWILTPGSDLYVVYMAVRRPTLLTRGRRRGTRGCGLRWNPLDLRESG